MNNKPNCYECKYRSSVPGDAHSTCKHPQAGGEKKDTLSEVMAIFAGVGRHVPVVDAKAAEVLGIKANPHGIRNGWFNWPYNFDPNWLEACKGFTQKEKPTAMQP